MSMDFKYRNRVLLNRVSQTALLMSGIAMTALFVPTPVLAQNVDESSILEEITVTGIRASITRSLDKKRDSVNVVDFLSAEDIGKFPDNNLSESLQRIPGVTINRSETGEGKQINVRGLGPQFSQTIVNGGNPISGFDFTLLPSEMFTEVSVEKSPTAKSVEGALGGTVRAETPKPFSHEGLRGAISGTAVLGEEGSTNPRVFALISKNWDDKFGVSLSGFYSTPQFESSEIGFGSWVPFRNTATAADAATLPDELLDAGTPRTPAFFKFTEDRENIAVAGTFQARPTDRLEITFDALYADVSGDRIDDRPDFWTSSTVPTNTTIENGVVTSGFFPGAGVQARVGTTQSFIDQEFFQGNFRADWQVNDKWTVSPGINVVRLNQSQAFNLFSFAINGADFQYNVDGDVPRFSTSVTDFASNPEDFGFNLFLFDTRNIKNEEETVTLDVTRSFEDDSPFSAFNFGIRYADRDRIATNSQRSFLFTSAPIAQGTSLADVAVLRDFGVGGAPDAMNPDQILGVDPDAAKALFFPNSDGFDFANTDFVESGRDVLNFSVNEETFTGYVSMDMEWGDVRMNAGLRYVRTEVTAIGNQVVGSVVTPRRVTDSYEDYLPSFNATYEVIDNGFIRASYSRTVNRPTLDDLRPSQAINTGSLTGSRGNPTLDPFRSDMLDLGFEYFFREGALFQVTGFVKEIGTLITLENVNEVATFPDQLTGEPTTGVISFTQPVNGESASILGLELGFTTPFYFLDGFGKDFGIILNYTYADSSASTEASDGTTRETVLPGLSKHSVNAALYYDRAGFSSRLAYTWRDSYLRDDNVGRQFGAERFFEDYGQLDFSLTVPVIEGTSVSFEVLNIFDSKSKEFSLLPSGATPPTNITERERMFLITARATF